MPQAAGRLSSFGAAVESNHEAKQHDPGTKIETSQPRVRILFSFSCSCPNDGGSFGQQCSRYGGAWNDAGWWRLLLGHVRQPAHKKLALISCTSPFPVPTSFDRKRSPSCWRFVQRPAINAQTLRSTRNAYNGVYVYCPYLSTFVLLYHTHPNLPLSPSFLAN